MNKTLKIIIILAIVVSALFLIVKNDRPKSLATDNQITGGTWSTTCAGSAASIHDGNIGTGVTCSGLQEINWDFGGNYEDIFRVRIYSSDADGANSFYDQCWYEPNGIVFNCGGFGYPDWGIITEGSLGPLSPGWNNEDIVPRTHSKLKLIINPSGGMMSFKIEEVEVHYSGSGPSTSPTPPPPTPTPKPSGGTPTPTTTIIGGTDLPYDPTKPIETPTENFNLKLDIPNGGEVWNLGQKYKIKWSSRDIDQKISSIGLFLSLDGGQKYSRLIANNLANNGEYDWIIADDKALLTDEAKVLVAAISKDNKVLLNDSSDNNFTIKDNEPLPLKKKNGLTWLAILLLLLGSGAVLWPITLNYLLNSSAASLLNRFSLLSAPTMGNKKGTGIVFDSYSQRPIPRALVRLFNADNQKLLESVITNNKGEFSFLLPSGNYYLNVISTQYDFPSQKLKKKLNLNQEVFTPGVSDGNYSNLYLGEKIINSKDGGADKRYALNINIPLDKTSNYNLTERATRFLQILGNILLRIKWPSLILGLAASIYSFLVVFSLLNLIILELYLLVILYELYRHLAKGRPFGLVFDESKKPIDLALIRFKNNQGRINSTSISGRDGKFTATVNPGKYLIASKKIGYSEDSRDISIKSTRKLEGLDIKLRKI